MIGSWFSPLRKIMKTSEVLIVLLVAIASFCLPNPIKRK